MTSKSPDQSETQWTAPNPLPLLFKSERLVIRAFTPEDAQELQSTIEHSRELITPWVPWCRTGHLDVESTLAEIMQFRMEFRKPEHLSRIIMGVYLKSTGQLVGGTGIHLINANCASCESGYWSAVDHTRKGYTEEACRRTISWAMSPKNQGGMGLNRVGLFTSHKNIPSINLISKLKITKEVEQRNEYFDHGLGVTNRLGWGVLVNEWDCEKHCAINPITHA